MGRSSNASNFDWFCKKSRELGQASPFYCSAMIELERMRLTLDRLNGSFVGKKSNLRKR
jgi:hypothetical protein